MGGVGGWVAGCREVHVPQLGLKSGARAELIAWYGL